MPVGHAKHSASPRCSEALSRDPFADDSARHLLRGRERTAGTGAVSAHFAVTNANVRLDIDEAQILARRALGEAAYRAALGRGAVMEDDEVVGYALGELQRLSDCPMPQ